MPAYNAAKTLEKTVSEVDRQIVDEIILVDDASSDLTIRLAQSLNLRVFAHTKNKGYGANQKTCYTEALKNKADIIVMVHPDYQYSPKLIPSMAYLIESGLYDIVLGSRVLSGGALRGGMPMYKYIANRLLTLFQNFMTGMKLAEFHTGYRAFSKQVLTTVKWTEFSDDFVFDNQMLLDAHRLGFRIAEITCPTKYFPEASSINFARSVKYGMGCVLTTFSYLKKKHLS